MKKTTTTLYIRPEDDLPVASLMFIAGHWKLLFTDREREIVLAEALNCCTIDHPFRHALVGYLITERRICVVLKIAYEHVPKFARVFTDEVRKSVARKMERMNKTELKSILNRESLSPVELLENIFWEFPMVNEDLIRLITGRKVISPYYNPHLEKLKDRVRQYNFCSAIDYAGAKGPVIVTLMK